MSDRSHVVAVFRMRAMRLGELVTVSGERDVAIATLRSSVQLISAQSIAQQKVGP